MYVFNIALQLILLKMLQQVLLLIQLVLQIALLYLVYKLQEPAKIIVLFLIMVIGSTIFAS